MALATRVIPVLLQRGGTLVKGEKFNSWRSVGHALQAVRIHAARQVDELIYLDIGATPAGKPPNFALVETLTEVMFSPITVGGGITEMSHVERLFNSGADKVCLGTGAVDLQLVEAIASRYGSQCLTISIDYLDNEVMTHCGRRRTIIAPSEWAKVMEDCGAGEILLNSIDRDGTMVGYDLPMLSEVCESVSIPVIACGGAGSPEHCYRAITAGAHAVAAGALFQFSDTTPLSVTNYFADRGVEVRT